jgi:rubrerythrin
MNPIDYALAVEKEGEAYYTELADQTSNPGLKKICQMLAGDERSHYTTFKTLKDDIEIIAADTTILSDAKTIFENMTVQNISDMDMTQKEMYQNALTLEQKTIAHYEQTHVEMTDPQITDMFIKILEEEKQHVLLLENIIEFLSRPDDWIENAEFNHLEDY